MCILGILYTCYSAYRYNSYTVNRYAGNISNPSKHFSIHSIVHRKPSVLLNTMHRKLCCCFATNLLGKDC